MNSSHHSGTAIRLRKILAEVNHMLKRHKSGQIASVDKVIRVEFRKKVLERPQCFVVHRIEIVIHLNPESLVCQECRLFKIRMCFVKITIHIPMFVHETTPQCLKLHVLLCRITGKD